MEEAVGSAKRDEKTPLQRWMQQLSETPRRGGPWSGGIESSRGLLCVAARCYCGNGARWLICEAGRARTGPGRSPKPYLR